MIEKFAETLQSPLWKEISSNLSHHKGDYENEMMKFNDFDKRISDGLMMKLFVICIITVSDLLNKSKPSSCSLNLILCRIIVAKAKQ